MKVEKIKLTLEVVKYKLTLFSSILGAGIYLLINKTKILETVNELIFYSIVGTILIYGFLGFVVNILTLNDIQKDIENERI